MKIIEGVRDDIRNLDVRFVLFGLPAKLFPPLVGNRLRTKVLRAAGLSIGEGTTIGGQFRVQGDGRPARRVRIGSDGWINSGCVLDASAAITIGDRVAIGQGVTIITNTHEIGAADRRAGLSECFPVVVGDGVWIGANATVLPNTVIGDGAIIAAGAVVNRDVDAHTVVAGVPARVVRTLEPDPAY